MGEDFLHRSASILKRIHSRCSFQEVADEILKSAVKYSRSHFGSFVRVDWKTRYLNIVSTTGDPWTHEGSGLRLRVGDGITGHVAATGVTYRCDDTSQDERYISVLPNVRSELAIPVHVDGRVWGIVNLDAEEVGHYDDTTVLRMELLASIVASAIEFRLSMEKERALTASLAEAEKLSAMGHLVAGIAHEVNNPLASILGCAELLAGKSEDPEIDTSILLIRQQAKRAGDLVKQLLGFARMGKPEHKENSDLCLVVREALDMVRPQLRLSSVSLDEALPHEETWSSEINRVQIQQVLINLVTNAQHAIEHAGIKDGNIRVEIEGRNGFAEIIVTDNGPGIPPQLAPKIFEPFFTTKDSGKGTGLGLSISRDIAIYHGGDLFHESSPTGGCRFSLSLPAVTAQSPFEEEQQDSNVEPAAPLDHTPDILIVDDEAPIRWMLKRLFSPHARSVALAESAEEALALQKERSFDVIVSDLHLPGLDGIEMFSRLVPEANLRFVLITGDSSSPRVARFVETENVQLLEKPFSLEDLKRHALATDSIVLAR